MGLVQEGDKYHIKVLGRKYERSGSCEQTRVQRFFFLMVLGFAQSIMLARQALYHLSDSTSPSFFYCVFLRKGLRLFAWASLKP
jgi:hypothetical protein